MNQILIQRLKLIYNGYLTIQRVVWPKNSYKYPHSIPFHTSKFLYDLAKFFYFENLLVKGINSKSKLIKVCLTFHKIYFIMHNSILFVIYSCGPRISAQCVSHSMTNSIFIWKLDFYWLFENDLESPLIFVLFLKG